jgi:hypothetical protein
MTNQHIRETPIDDEVRLKDRVLELGARLFFDSHELWPLYPDPSAEDFAAFKRGSDPLCRHDSPARLVNELKSTYPGCCWLLERWNELRIRTLPGKNWTAFDKFKAIRLLSKQPLDVLDDASGDLAVVFLATHAICPTSKDPFGELRCEVEDLQFAAVRNRLKDRCVKEFAPVNEDAARQLLNNLIGREIGRLERLALKCRHEAEAAERDSRLAFDPSDEADKVRRYEDAAIRRMSRACADFIKVRESGALEDGGESELASAKTPDVVGPEPDSARGSEQAGTPDGPWAGVNGDRPPRAETANSAAAAQQSAAVPSASAQRSETAVPGSSRTVDAAGAPLMGLLLLILLAWLMVSGQGSVLRRGPMRSSFTAQTECAPPRFAPSRGIATEPIAAPSTNLGPATATMRAMRKAGTQEAADLVFSCFPAFLMQRFWDRAATVDRPMAIAPSANTRGVDAQTGERHQRGREGRLQNKAMAICAGRAGPADQRNPTLTL